MKINTVIEKHNITTEHVMEQLTPERVTLIKNAAGYGLTQHQIAVLLGIMPTTFEKWIAVCPQITELLEEGMALEMYEVAKTAFKLAKSGECPSMTMFVLKTKGGWRETHRIELNGKFSFVDLVLSANDEDEKKQIAVDESDVIDV